ncbi:tRNA-Thr(GGU) m(6)t(6)A37 methyltransferase TsaA [Haloactinopolyspora alba]|uniref:tRNA-Thr(GGU) m(6)t(6)A37 methyltransferase TsaA n=1 Tax=Haloactinopolyspora alba TaxID=648780 RepID=A0A2P8DWE2_9ACTN|nr:SAM-dependent methyltransferase [Haloactinopolyspora alba]PSL01550.1 tRNA-Thr(GGU) m(6)t(6)A37 methyltransferase TsaA [Haloactinopolyspora alba]
MSEPSSASQLGPMVAVGRVRNHRTDPGDSDGWGDVVSRIVLDERFGDHALTGLEEFSHVLVLYQLDQLDERADYTGVRRPRGRDDLPAVGLFADRGPRRPNRIGVTACPIVRVGATDLEVRGLDAVDGTPVLDLKPVMHEFEPSDVRQPAWVAQLMSEYFER